MCTFVHIPSLPIYVSFYISYFSKVSKINKYKAFIRVLDS